MTGDLIVPLIALVKIEGHEFPMIFSISVAHSMCKMFVVIILSIGPIPLLLHQCKICHYYLGSVDG